MPTIINRRDWISRECPRMHSNSISSEQLEIISTIESVSQSESYLTKLITTCKSCKTNLEISDLRINLHGNNPRYEIYSFERNSVKLSADCDYYLLVFVPCGSNAGIISNSSEETSPQVNSSPAHNIQIKSIMKDITLLSRSTSLNSQSIREAIERLVELEEKMQEYFRREDERERERQKYSGKSGKRSITLEEDE